MKPPYPKRTSLLCAAIAGMVSLTAVAQDEKKRVFEQPDAPGVKTDFTEVPEGWMVGLDRAQKLAERSGKDMLLDFAGSDWIPPSIDLEERVFSSEEFIEAASKDFILVRLDFPRKLNVQSKELQRKNLEAVAKYEVTSYPTVILTDPKGRPYGTTGWKQGISVESFLKRMAEMQEKRKRRDAHWEAAQEAEGEEKVRHIVKFLEGKTPPMILKFYGPEYRLALELDPVNYGGLGPVVFYEKSLAMRKELDALAQEGKWEEAVAALDAFRDEHCKTNEQKQQIEFFKLNGLLQLERWNEVMPFLDRIIEMGPDTPVGKKAAEVKPELMKRIAAGLKNQRRQEQEKKAEDGEGQGQEAKPQE